MNRADFLRLTTAASASWVTSALLPRRLAAGQPSRDREASVARIIQAYDAQGLHRTGTDTDHRSATWLLEEAQRAGSRVDATLEPFALDRLDPGVCRIEVDGTTVEGLPLFDGTFTHKDGISGRMGEPGSAADIVVLQAKAADISSEGRSLAELRRSTRHRAVVVVTYGAHSGLSPMNAASFSEPFGLPVLQVASEHGAWLEGLARAGATARFIAEASRTRVEASNVVARVPGQAADLPPLVVMTPRSGWWQCASERGGGIVCWLHAIGAAAEARPLRQTLFVASSGHELGHLGLESFIERRHDLVASARAWVHLGANIGAAGGQVRLQVSDDEIEGLAVSALGRAGASAAVRAPRGTVPAGEARNIHVAGGRYVSLLGSNPLFHNPRDRWPDAVDAGSVARFAAAVGDLVVVLAGGRTGMRE